MNAIIVNPDSNVAIITNLDMQIVVNTLNALLPTIDGLPDAYIVGLIASSLAECDVILDDGSTDIDNVIEYYNGSWTV